MGRRLYRRQRRRGLARTRLRRSSPSCSPGTTANGTKAGIIGGGHIGYNWQSNNFVYGVEADISGSSAKVTLQPFGAGPVNETDTSRLHWLATFRARAGVTVGSGNTLLFATGGLALGGVENLRMFPPAAGVTPAEIGEGKATRVGWVAGGGIEHMLSRNWIVRAEALYVDLGDKTTAVPTQRGHLPDPLHQHRRDRPRRRSLQVVAHEI